MTRALPGSRPAAPHRRIPSRRAVLLAGAAALPAAATLGTVAVASPAHADPAVTGGETRTLDLELSSLPQRPTAEGSSARVIAGIRATMLGATWQGEGPDVAAARGLDLDGTWSDWIPLEIAIDPEAGTVLDALEPSWLGAVQEIELVATREGEDATSVMTAHVLTTSPAAPDPLIDAGQAPSAGPATPEAVAQNEAGAQSDSASSVVIPSGGGAGGTAPTGGGRRMLRLPGGGLAPMAPTAAAEALLLAPDAPVVIARSAWGADETLGSGVSGADDLRAVVVHHTAGTNSYSQADVPQILRGIHSYHTRTLGWADVGYNVLVDKFGRLYEGRKGGLHRNIVGAHARGFNAETFGISVMGDYMSAAPPQVAMDALVEAISWKLGGAFRLSSSESAPHQVAVSGTKWPVGATVSLQRVTSHRDVNYTDCPGNAFYARMGALRTSVQSRLDRRWRAHRDAFTAAGGSAVLGTVREIAHVEGAYLVTRLTAGAVLSPAGQPDAARVSAFSEWDPSWGLPVEGIRSAGNRRVQPFESGVASVENGQVRFVPRRFADVEPQRQFYLEVNDLAARGIATGWPDGTFRPDASHARDAMVVYVHRALGAPDVALPARSPFRDLTPSTQFYREIVWAHQAGIVQGWPDGTFRPTAPIERGAVAAFLHRAAGSPQTTAAPTFSDVPASHQFAREIAWCASAGITTGWPDGTFRPDALIGREAMAAFTLRWLAAIGR